MAQTRQLAAIMFTDIAGYTALMGEDEQKAFELLEKNRQLHQQLFEQYGGKWIKEIGDGILASFFTVTDAVSCASAIQQSCMQIPDLKLRIGIHQGEVVFEDNDVFGDTVNIASRIQAIAPVGCIWISEPVYNNISNKKNIKTRFVRPEYLKNVKDVVRVYEVITNHTDRESNNLSAEEKTTNKIIPQKSIAVLPFINMSNDPEQEYFSDGIAEEILTSLSTLKDLKVTSRISSSQFKGVKVDLHEVGQKLKVSSVLEGSVRKQGNRLRITAQLINVEDGYQLWSERYDRSMDDIFEIQDEIALAITDKLKVILYERDRSLITRSKTRNAEAYNLYLKGRFYWNKRGQGLKEGLKYFLQAVEVDTEFALAYAGIADSYALLALYCMIPPHEAMPKAKQAAEKAIYLDTSLVEAYNTLAFVSTFYDWNWAEAKKRYQRAFEVNSKYAPAHYWYSLYLSWVECKYEESIREAKKAMELLEPLVSGSHHLIAVMLITAGKFEAAVKESQMAIELDANSFPAFRTLGISLAGLNRYPEAIEALNNSARISLRHQTVLGELCWVYSLSGQESEVHKIMDELIIRSRTEFISGLFLCCAAYYSKNYSKALEFLEMAFEQRDGTLISIKVWPPFAFIKSDLRFQSYLEKMNFLC